VRARTLRGSDAATQTPVIPQEVRDTLTGLAFAAGGANVVMQLSRLPVGHGVALSKVDSGRVDKHPLKRLRTTSAFLVIALLGTEEERLAIREEINRAHSAVRSEPTDPVQYNAFDPELQLWVAACLYKGAEDIYILYHGTPDPATIDKVLYPHCKRLGTTLQVTDEMWPADRAAFEEYWNAGIAKIEMDDLTRGYLQGVANLSFVVAPLGIFGAPLRPLLRPIGRFLTLGFLPQPFRDELGLPWSDRGQRGFDALIRAAVAVTRKLPRPLREFPLNAYLWDARRRIRKGRRIV
jgi:uncharacterized protein (DUF2236 family)